MIFLTPDLTAQKVARPTSLPRFSLTHILGAVRSQPMAGWMIMLGIVALAAFLRLFMLSSQSLWLDEGASLAMTDSGNTLGTLDALWSISGGDKYQAVYFLLLSHWRSLVGDSQFYLQSLSVIPGVLTPLLIYVSVKILFGTRHAVCSAVFIACSAYCISFSQEVRPYAYLLFIASLHLLSMTPVLKGTDTSNINRWVFAFVTLLATLSSIFLVVFISTLAIAHLLVYRNVKDWFRWWIPSMFMSIPALLYYSGTPASTNLSVDAINNTGNPIWENMVYALYSHLAGQTYGPAVNTLRDTDNVTILLMQHGISLSVLAMVALALVWCVVRALRGLNIHSGQNACVVFFVTLSVLSFVAATAFAYITSINWMPRHSFYLMVPLSVLISIAVVQGSQAAGKGQKSIARGIPFIVYPALLVINLFSSYQYFFQPDHLLDDYRSAANYLSDNVSEEDASIMLWGEPYLLSYYGHTQTRSLWRLENPTLIMSEIEAAALTSNDVYITINRESTWERYSNTLQGQLNQSYNLVPKAQFTNFTIYRLEKNDTVLAENAQKAATL